MINKNLKYEEIIKALECCPLYDGYPSCEIDTIAFINQQKAEIEKLKSENEILSRNADNAFQEGLNECRELFEPEIKSEAVKECLAKVKNYIKTHCNPYGKPDFEYDTSIKILNFIDNLLKEMVGENK